MVSPLGYIWYPGALEIVMGAPVIDEICLERSLCVIS